MAAIDDRLTIAGALTRATNRLIGSSDTPRLDAEVLLRNLLRVNRTQLIVDFPQPIEPDQLAVYDALVEKRRLGTPVAYLTGIREFMGLDFAVGPGVLVPRPETELLVERALQWLNPRSSARILDLGTGSGAIAVSIAALADPDLALDIVAVDLSPDALRYAKINVHRWDELGRVKLVEGDLSDSINGPFDLVLANLPYLTPFQFAGSPSIAEEPQMALIGGIDGLQEIRRAVADLPRILSSGGVAGFEIDPSQSAEVGAMVEASLPDAQVTVIDDFAGLARHVWAVRSRSTSDV